MRAMRWLLIFLALPVLADDPIIVPPPTVSCVAPLLWHTNRCECANGSLPSYSSYGTPVCVQPPPPAGSCYISITYVTPTIPVLTKSPECDEAGADLALAVALAKRLGQP